MTAVIRMQKIKLMADGLEKLVWDEIDKICGVNNSWIEMRNQESCVSIFAGENGFEIENAEGNVFVTCVVESLQEKGVEDVDAESVNEAFISYFYRDEMKWPLDISWGITLDYMRDGGWDPAQSLEFIIDYLEKEKISTESLKNYFNSDECELDDDDEDVYEQMQRVKG